jgi:hypothetical protein
MGTNLAVGDNGCARKAAGGDRSSEMSEGGSGVVDDQLNVPLEDAELLAEVELTTNLIIAASESETALPQDQVDRLLGLDPDDTQSFPVPPQTRHTA